MADDIFTQETVDKLNASALTFNEVVTSRAGGVSSGAIIDQTLTPLGETTDTLKGRLDKLGIIYTDWGSAIGGTLTTPAQAFLNNTVGSDGFGNYYSWSGSFPKAVAPGTDPAASGSGYTPRTDVVLRPQLAAADGYKLIGACIDIAAARALTGLDDGDRVNVVGYYSSTPLVGGGTFVADASDTTTADDGGMALVTADGVRLKRWLGFSGFAGVISALWFGCVGDGATDNTAMSQAALTYATNNGYHLSYPAGVFYHAGQVTKPQGFTAPNIYCAGANNQPSKSTVLWFDSAIGLKIKGGSGSLARSAIYNCVLRGKADKTNVPLQFADICGFDAIKCRFENSAFAAEFYNEASGGFTEFCRLVDCEITTSCLQAVSYRRGSGNDSFHGSGISGNTVINEATGSALSQIVIGSGCLPYNSPLSFTVFKRSSTAIVQNDSGHVKVNFFGNICYESSSSYSPPISSGSVLTFVGGVNCLTQGLTRGTAILAERVTVNSDASVTKQLLKFNNVQTISSGNVLSGTNPDNNDAYLIHLTLSASNYEYSYLLAVYRNRGDSSGSVQTLATLRAFNTAGYGAPTFSYSGGVVVTNASYPAATVTARFTATPIGARGNFPLL